MITSPTNPMVKDLVRLRTRRHRDRERRFLIEGRRPVALAIQAGVAVDMQIVSASLGGEAVEGVPVVEMAEHPFRKLSSRHTPDGVLAVAHHLDTTLDHVALPPDPLVLVVEAIEKPGNLGAMLRTCDGLGVDAVVVTEGGTDVHNPNVVQASQGALFSVPVAVGGGGRTREWLRDNGARLVATVPEGGSPPWLVDLGGAVALAVGAEDSGLSADTMAAADETMTIPMQGRVDSLNASVTAALGIYEAIRQRRQG